MICFVILLAKGEKNENANEAMEERVSRLETILMDVMPIVQSVENERNKLRSQMTNLGNENHELRTEVKNLNNENNELRSKMKNLSNLW